MISPVSSGNAAQVDFLFFSSTEHSCVSKIIIHINKSHLPEFEIFLGAPDALGGSGAVYVFSVEDWIFRQKIVSNVPAPGDHFGYALASEGNHFLIGAPDDDDPDIDAGAVHVSFYDGASWNIPQPIGCKLI